MDVNWLVSLLASIPLSILANLLTPRLKNWWGRQSLSRSRHRISQLESDLARIAKYASSASELSLFLSASILRFLFLFAFASAATALGTALLPTVFGPFSSLIVALATGFYLSSGLLAADALETLRKVRDFEQFQASQNKIISGLKAATERKGIGESK